MSWDEYVCLGKTQACSGYRGAPCDCLEPYGWTESEKYHRPVLTLESQLREALAAVLHARLCVGNVGDTDVCASCGDDAHALLPLINSALADAWDEGNAQARHDLGWSDGDPHGQNPYRRRAAGTAAGDTKGSG